MMQLKLWIDVENAAFDGMRLSETARLLRQIAARMENGEAFYPCYETIFDSNGNDVGRVAFKDSEAN